VGAVLSIRNLRHGRRGRLVLRVDGLDLEPGERLAVLGSNGAGKTTLLRLIAGLEYPTDGTLEVDGVRTTDADVEHRRRIGYATQRPGLLSTTVRKNLELPLRWRGVSRAQRRVAAFSSLERLGVAHLADRPAFALSGGEAQRVSLARALAVSPAVLLLDEPAAGLDAQARQSFLDDLDTALADRETTIVHVSHQAEEALRLADRVAVLVDGAVRQLDDPAAVAQRPVDATVARLVGYDNVIPAEIDPTGQVLIAGKPSGLAEARPPGPATVAAWGAAIQLAPAAPDVLEATVERVSPSTGRWDIILAADPPLRAHLRLDIAPPRLADRVGVRIDATLATVIGAHSPSSHRTKDRVGVDG
jgi:ABC-type sulfate/molybdate transport systems ATPase subunit